MTDILNITGNRADLSALDTHEGHALIFETVMGCMGEPTHSAALLAVSIDNLDALTSMFSHAVASPILIELAQRFRENIRGSDVLARLADDQLGIVLPLTLPEGPALVARRLHMLGRERIMTHFGPIELQLTIAAAAFPDGALTANDVLAQVRSALAETRQAETPKMMLRDTLRQVRQG